MRPPSRTGFLRTRFARRTLLAFLGAAFLPSAVAGAVWFQRLRATLDREADAALAGMVRSAGVTVLERLDLLISRGAPGSSLVPGATRLGLSVEPTTGAAVWVARTAAATGERHDTLDLAPLWTALDQLIANDEEGFCLYTTEPLRRLQCSASVPAAVTQLIERAPAPGDAGAVRRAGGWRVAERELFLRAQYDAPTWRLAIARSDAPIVERLRDETRYLAAIGLLALVSAFTLSHIQLRRQTAPIEVLQQASRAVREGHLDTRVSVRSNDEFTEFGDAFNAMTHALQQQFALLSDVDALNEQALRASGETDLALAALHRLGERSGAVVVGVALRDDDRRGGVRYLTRVRGDAQALEGRGVLASADRAVLLAQDGSVMPRAALVGAERTGTTLVDGTVAAWREAPAERCLVLALRHEQELLGAVVCALPAGAEQDAAALVAERRLAERLALGLANARLLARLDALSIGTLRAFGSTIDANSRWTAGHSERVTRVAEQLGTVLQLDEAARATLTRGCLLHDIGKVGVPPAILDKAGRLTPDEFAVMQQHPVIGANILSTVPAFQDLLPIVRSHHERFDGTGYPDRLRGEEIPWLARIAAVADVFDALASARPYRDGMPLPAVHRIITDGAGSHFDPQVVQAFDTLVREQRLIVPPSTAAHDNIFPSVAHDSPAQPQRPHVASV